MRVLLRPVARRWVMRVSAAALLGMGAAIAGAQPAFPSRPVRLIVPFPPGGPADVLGRALAKGLADRWGQAVVVDNKPGGATVIAAVEAARAAPDGYTLFLPIDSTLTMNPALFSRLPYDPVRDFTPISLLAIQPLVLVANNTTSARTVAQLIEQAKAAPERINFGSGTIGTQLAGEMFNRATGVRLNHVPYKGGPDVAKALLGGEIQVSFDGIAANLQHIRSGRLHALATTGLERAAALPEVPTLNELGIKNYEARVWLGLMAPARTPPAIVEQIQSDAKAVLMRPDVRKLIEPLGFEPIASTPDALVQRMRADSARLVPLIKELGLKLD
jgi:tripartite-type tricarboxylate transporter receptor subunit TctC